MNFQVYDDGKLPRTICPGCNIQLEATVQFFQLLINGQNKIREMWNQQVEIDRKTEREQLRYKNINIKLANEMAHNAEEEDMSVESNEQQIFINGNNLMMVNLKKKNKNYILISVIPDGSVYNAEHNLSLQMDGLDKPRKKRGRPPKGLLDDEFKV